MRIQGPKSVRPMIGTFAFVTAALCCIQKPAFAGSYNTSVFASGSAVGATAPDSVTYGGGSLWIEYGNGASSTDYTGTSTIVQYNSAGNVLNTYSLPGSVDGLKYNPNTGAIWALQNQDASSQLSIINPATKAITTYQYDSGYSSVSGTRGFDDVAFLGNSAYLSFTNPATAGDPILVKLNSTTLSTPLTFTTVLTGTGLTATDPDSLKSTPTGGLVLTGGSDGTLTFISNPGTASQTAKSVALTGSNLGSLDDSVYVTATAGTFYVTSTTANTVYAISASGLTPGSLFASVGTQFGSVDPTTGALTPIFTGAGLHGAEFVAAPEPASVWTSLAGITILLFALVRKRLVS